MSRPRVNYDMIAPVYNKRFDDEQPVGTRTALVTLANSIGAHNNLEAGCGTAYWLSELRTGLAHDSQLYGLDFSAGMLAQARQRPEDTYFMQGAAEYIPIKNETLDLVFCVNALHHFSEPHAFINEARRVLRPGGTLAVVGADPHGRNGSWYVYDYFPGTYQRDLERFPSWGAIVDWVIDSGFKRFEWRLAEHIHDPKFGKDVLADPYLEKNATSQLALLSDREYALGLDRIKNAIAQAERMNEVLVFRCDIHQHILHACTPE